MSTDQPTAFSHLAGREVATPWAEWRHETEVAAVSAMGTAGQRSFFDGATDPLLGRKEHGVGDIRGASAVERIKADMMRLEDMRRRAGLKRLVVG